MNFHNDNPMRQRRLIMFFSPKTVCFYCLVFSVNSPIVVGFTYGFLSTFEIGVSILFLFKDYMLCQSKRKQLAAETGFILGRIFLCFSIYSKPFHFIFSFSREMSLCIWIYFLICLFLSIQNNIKDWILTYCEEKDRKWKFTAIAIQAFSIIYLFLNHILLQFLNLFLFPSPVFSRLIHLFLFRITMEKKSLFLISSFLGWLFGYFIVRNLLLKFISDLLLYLYENRDPNPRLKRQSRFPITRIESKKEREQRFDKNEWIESEKQFLANRLSCILLFLVFLFYSSKMPKFLRIGMYHPIFDTKVSTNSILEDRFADHEEKYKKKEKEFEKEEGSSEKGNRNSENSYFQDEDSDNFGGDLRSCSYPKQNSGGIESEEEEEEYDENENDPPKDPYSGTDLGGGLPPFKKGRQKGHGGKSHPPNSDPSSFSYDQKDAPKYKLILDRIFDTSRWHRPLRYIKTKQSPDTVRNAMSQYFFAPCQSDGQSRLCFTHPSALFLFLDLMEAQISQIEGNQKNEKYFYPNWPNWISENEQKKLSLSYELRDRIKSIEIKNIEILDHNLDFTSKERFAFASLKEYLEKHSVSDAIEKVSRVLGKEGYLVSKKDPFLNGSSRGKMIDIDAEISRMANSPCKEVEIQKEMQEISKELPRRKCNLIAEEETDQIIKDFRDKKNQEGSELIKNLSIQEILQMEIGEKKKDREDWISDIRVRHRKFLLMFKEKDKTEKEEEKELQTNNNNEEDLDEEDIDGDLDEEGGGIDTPNLRISEETIDPSNLGEEGSISDNENLDKESILETDSDAGVHIGSDQDIRKRIDSTRKYLAQGIRDLPIRNWVNGSATAIRKRIDSTWKYLAQSLRICIRNWVNDSADPDEEDSEYDGKKKDIENKKSNQIKPKSEGGVQVEMEKYYSTEYKYKANFRRNLIKGSTRAQRRKIGVFAMYQRTGHSPLFWIEKNISFFVFDWIFPLVFGNWIRKEPEIETKEEEMEEEKIEIEKRLKNVEALKALIKINKINYEILNKKIICKTVEDKWNRMRKGQIVRAYLLLFQCFFRKNVKCPLFIIVKSIGRILFFQWPEWEEDWRALANERYLKCTLRGHPVPKNEFPDDWKKEGLQIQIERPFRLKPWKGAHIGYYQGKPKEDDFIGFLTVFGEESEFPFGPPKEDPGSYFSSFFEPLFLELEIAYGKVKKKIDPVLNKLLVVFKEVIPKRRIHIPKIKRVLIEKVKKTNERGKEFWEKKCKPIVNKVNKVGIRVLQKVPILEEIIQKMNQFGFLEFPNPNEFIDKKKEFVEELVLVENEKKYRMTQEELILNLIDNIIQIRKKIEQIQRENPTLTDWKDPKSKPWKLIFKRKQTRFLCQLHYWRESFMERIYIDIFDIFLYIMNIVRVNVELFLLQPFMIEKNTKIADIEENWIPFILTIEKLFWNLNISGSGETGNEHSIPYYYDYDLSSLSQAYVFYKIAQTQVNNKNYLRSVLQYHGTHLFLKDPIKNYYETQGILKKHKKVDQSRIHEWKNWLKSHSQYNLSQTQWSRLVPQKWRNRVRTIPNENFMKWNSYKKEEDPYNGKDFRVNSLMGQKEKYKRNCRYDLLFNQYINYENSEDLSISEFPLQVNRDRENLYSSNFHIEDIEKPQSPSLLIMDDIDLSYYLDPEKGFRMDRTKERDKERFYRYRDHIHIPVPKDDPWFFQEFGILYDTYKTYQDKPWILPMHLLFHLDGNPNASPNLDLFDISNFDIENIDSIYSNSEDAKKETKDKIGSIDLSSILFSMCYSYIPPLLFELDKNTYICKNLFQWEYESETLDMDMYTNIWGLNISITELDENASYFEKEGFLILNSVVFEKWDDKWIMWQIYQIIGISLVDQNQYQMNGKCINKYVDKKNLEKSTAQEYGNLFRNENPNDYDFLVPEHILSTRHRRKLRILSCFHSWNQNVVNDISRFSNENNVKNCGQFMSEDPYTHIDPFMKFKLFMWPNYRLEDLACMNRYWFNTHNGSRFTILRIHMYPRF